MKKYAKYAFMFLIASAAITITTYYYKQSEQQKNRPVAISSLLVDSESIKAAAAKRQNRRSNLANIYTQTPLDSLTMPTGDLSEKFLKALSNQLALIDEVQSRSEKLEIGSLRIARQQLERTVKTILTDKSAQNLSETLEAYQLCGDDRKGNVRFTGYYSPIIAASHRQAGAYRYPVYTKTSRGEGLHAVYVKSKQDLYDMRIEGSAYLQFPDGEKRLYAFSGNYQETTTIVGEEQEENNALTDIKDEDKKEKALKTTYSAVFTSSKAKPIGAARIPLTADYTVAVDKRYIPLGSVLLAQVPIMGDKGKVIRYEYRLLLAQDTGSAIKGAGHVDLYMGEGEAGKAKAQSLHQYGKIWLLLPKNEESQKPKLLAQKM